LWRSKSLWAVAALAVLLRLGVFLAVEHPLGLFQFPDSAEYDQLGWNLAFSGSYSLSAAEPRAPDLTRTPVYPVFLACCYKLLGDWPAAAVAIQLGLGTATCLLAYVMAARLFGPRAGLVSGGLLALDPLSIHYSTLLLSDTLFTLLFTGSLFCLLAYARPVSGEGTGSSRGAVPPSATRRPRLGTVLATAVLSALAVLCRPIAIFWPVVPLLVFGILAWRRRQWRPLVHAGLFAVVIGVSVGAWVIRNWQVGGLPVFSTVEGRNLYYHRAAPIVAQQENITVDEARLLLEQRLRDSAPEEPLDEQSEYRRMERAGRDIILTSPGTYLWLHARGVVRMLAPREKPLRWHVPDSLQKWFEVGFLGVVYVLALVGLANCLWSREWLGLLFGVVVLYFAVLSGPEAYARFRVPVMPAFVMLAGLGATISLRSMTTRPKFQCR
jgi:4-amino-4-deoxy-L-arabinose transferase-like glycosyltransferase